MFNPRGRLSALSLVLIFVLSFTFSVHGADENAAVPTKTSSSGDVLAKVGEEVITRELLESEIEKFVATSNPNAKKFLETQEGKKQFLQQMVEILLMDMEAKSLKLAENQDLQGEIKDVTIALISQQYIGDMLKDVKSSKKEIEDYYAANKDRFTEPEKYHIHQMTFKDDKSAEKAKKDLESGKSFQDLARDQSCDTFKSGGGDRGFVSVDDLPPQLAQAIAGLKQDQVSDLVKVADDQILLVKFSELQPGKVQSLESVNDQIDRDLANDKRRSVYDEQLEGLKKKFGFTLNKDSFSVLKKEELTPSDLETVIFTIGSQPFKIESMAPELERIPAFIRPHIFSGSGLDDFVKQAYSRELVKLHVTENFAELTGKYPDATKDAEKRVSLKKILDDNIGSKVTLTDQELKDYYTKNLDQFKQPESVKAHHILVKEEAEAKALLEKLGKGEKFEELAKTESICPSGKQGGDLGAFNKGQMVKEFDDAAQTAEIGKVVGPVKTQFGYHLIRVDERQPAQTLSFESVQDQLKEQLLPKKQQKAYQDYIETLKKKYPLVDNTEKL